MACVYSMHFRGAYVSHRVFPRVIDKQEIHLSILMKLPRRLPHAENRVRIPKHLKRKDLLHHSHVEGLLSSKHWNLLKWASGNIHNECQGGIQALRSVCSLHLHHGCLRHSTPATTWLRGLRRWQHGWTKRAWSSHNGNATSQVLTCQSTMNLSHPHNTDRQKGQMRIYIYI